MIHAPASVLRNTYIACIFFSYCHYAWNVNEVYLCQTYTLHITHTPCHKWSTLYMRPATWKSIHKINMRIIYYMYNFTTFSWFVRKRIEMLQRYMLALPEEWLKSFPCLVYLRWQNKSLSCSLRLTGLAVLSCDLSERVSSFLAGVPLNEI
jgi:hypothetical protein